MVGEGSWGEREGRERGEGGTRGHAPRRPAPSRTPPCTARCRARSPASWATTRRASTCAWSRSSRTPPCGLCAHNKSNASVSLCSSGRGSENAQVLRASNALWMCGSRFVGRPLGLSGSGTKCGSSDASHLCCSASAAVGREAGSIVRHSDTKSRAVSETFAQYSSVKSGPLSLYG